MKHILWLGVVFCLLVGLLLVPHGVSASPGNAITVDAPATVGEGASFIARVNIDNVKKFDACNYDVVFDHTVLDLTDVTDGVIGTTTIPVVGWNKLADGKYRVAENVGGHTGVTGGGYLAELHFDVVGSGTTDIDLQNGTVSDKNAKEIDCTWTKATVTVSALTADFTVSPTEGYEGDTTFTFTDTTTGGTTPYTYAWTFGDTGTSTLADPTHMYANDGDYTVTLTITDSLLLTDTETKVALISVYNTLVADFSATPVKGILGTTHYPTTVNFTDQTIGGKPGYTYSWDFNNDATEDSTAQNPSFDFTAFGAGKYTVTLTANDSLTATDDETKTDYITIYPQGDINESVTLEAADVTKIEHIVAADPAHPATFTADASDDTNINALDITMTEILVILP